MELYKIEGFETLSKMILRWVSYQRRDPEQAINSICAELGDPRRLPIAIERLASETPLTKGELHTLTKVLGKCNLRALSYLLRADLKVNYNRLRTLWDQVNSSIQKVVSTVANQNVESIAAELLREKQDIVKEIASMLNCEIEEIKRRIEARTKRELETKKR
jgi:AraC-like DNA-binding protein